MQFTAFGGGFPTSYLPPFLLIGTPVPCAYAGVTGLCFALPYRSLQGPTRTDLKPLNIVQPEVRVAECFNRSLNLA